MSSKTILDLDRAAHRVLAGARDTRNELLAGMEQRLQEDGVRSALVVANGPVVAQTGDAADVVLTAQAVTELQEPDLEQVVSFAVWMIDFYRQKMVEADETHLAEIQEDWRVREARDDAAAAAYQDLLNLRGMVEAALHPRAAESLLGIRGLTPREPLALAKTLQATIRRLRADDVDLPEIRIAGMVQDWEVLTRALEERHDALQAAIDAVVAEVEAAKRRRRAKERAIQRYRDAAVGWTGVVRHLLIAAGLRDAADELPATSPRRQAASPVDDSLPELPDGDLPVSDVPPRAEAPEPDLPPEVDDLPTPANEPEPDVGVA